MEKQISLDEIKAKYENEIKKLDDKNKYLMEVYNIFFKYFDKYKNLGNIAKAINKELENKGISVYFYDSYGTTYLNIYNKNYPYNDKSIKLSMYNEKDLSLRENWNKGFLREFSFDYIAKYKQELKQIESIYKKYNQVLKLLEELKNDSPDVTEEIPFNIREPKIHHKGHSYF